MIVRLIYILLEGNILFNFMSQHVQMSAIFPQGKFSPKASFGFWVVYQSKIEKLGGQSQNKH